jgi:hypothetical protein
MQCNETLPRPGGEEEKGAAHEFTWNFYPASLASVDDDK